MIRLAATRLRSRAHRPSGRAFRRLAWPLPIGGASLIGHRKRSTLRLVAPRSVMPQKSNGLLAYLQLFRLPNVFTAAADVMAGYLVAHRAFEPVQPLYLLIAASCLLYVAGMVLNDVFDIEQDRRERPHRPIPSGRVHPAFAANLGRAFLAAGVVLGWGATYLARDLRCGSIATALAAAVYLYDRVLKRTALGPIGMGACRFLNVLLGMSTAAIAWQAPHYAFAAGIGIFITGVTWFARTEAVESSRGQLAAATALMLAGFVPLYLMPRMATSDVVWLNPIEPERWAIFWCLIAVVTGWRCVRAAANPQPAYVQTAVKHAILSLIVLDAAASFPAGGITTLYILMLVFPMVILGQFVYST
jgi:4-hydroxybenzoate polyprenyltransferase